MKELIAAIKECLPDLKHYAKTHGPGPDQRLEHLQEILKGLEDKE
jgi:hypothetical protein